MDRISIIVIYPGWKIVEYRMPNFNKDGKIVAGNRRTFDNTSHSTGLVPHYGSLQFLDFDNSLKTLHDQGLLVDGLRVIIFLNAQPYVENPPFTSENNFAIYYFMNMQRVLGEYVLSNISLIGDDFKSDLGDIITSWSSVFFRGVSSDANNTGLTFFNALNSSIGNIIKITSNDSAYLNSISIPDGVLLPSKLPEAFETFCNATGTTITRMINGAALDFDGNSSRNNIYLTNVYPERYAGHTFILSKDQYVGKPIIQRVLRNKKDGVFGNIASVALSSSTSVLTESSAVTSCETTPIDKDSTVLQGVVRWLPIRLSPTQATHLEFKFGQPFAIEPADVIVKFNFQTTAWLKDENTTTPPGWWINLQALIVGNIIPGSSIPFEFNEIPPEIQQIIDTLPLYSTSKKTVTVPITNLQINQFGVTFDIDNALVPEYSAISDNMIRAGYFTVPYPYYDGLAQWSTLQTISIQINGKSFEFTPNMFHVGGDETFELQSNTLLTTNSRKDTEPLYQFLANKIINEWLNGKEVLTLKKVINHNQDVQYVGDQVIVVDCVASDITDVNLQSISRNPNGTAKKYVIDSTEMIYDGSLTQILELSEKTV